MNKTLQLVLICCLLLAVIVPAYGQNWYYGVFDEFNDPRGANPIGIRGWGMGGVRTALEQLGGGVIYSPAGMAWDYPAFLSGEFDVRTPFPKGTDPTRSESQTLFLPRYMGMAFPAGKLRFGLAYAVPYGHRVVYRTSLTTYEYPMAEHRIVIPFAWRVSDQWAVGVTLGLSIVSWKEIHDGTETDNSASGLGFASVLHVQWKPQPTMTLGIEAQLPITVSGDAKINSVTFSENWERPLEVRVGIAKKWTGFITALDVFFRQYSAIDSWMVDRGRMTKDQWGLASGVEFPMAGADWRIGGYLETDPVEGGDQLMINITAGVGWNLRGTNVQAALVDSHASSDESLRATRFQLGFEILTPRNNNDDGS